MQFDLKAYRSRFNLSQAGAAVLIDVSQQTWARYELSNDVPKWLMFSLLYVRAFLPEYGFSPDVPIIIKEVEVPAAPAPTIDRTRSNMARDTSMSEEDLELLRNYKLPSST